MKEYFENPRTKTIHIVGDFPRPRTFNTVMCGQKIDDLEQIIIDPKEIIPYYRWCLTCKDLTDE